MRWSFIAVLLVTIVAQAGLRTRLYADETRLDAHEKFKIVGKVVAVKTDEVAVKSIDGATYEIDMLESTVVTDKNHKKLDKKELKPGLSVVVMALGHDMFDLEAFEVQLTDR